MAPILPREKQLIDSPFGPLELNWSRHALGDQRCLRLKVRLPQSFDPIAMLQSARDWTFVWRGRDDGFLTIAMDALQVIHEAERLRCGRDPQLAWFGGQTFFGESHAAWGDLSQGLWFLPALTLKLADDQSIVILQTLAPESAGREDLLQRLHALFDQLLSQQRPALPRPRLQGIEDFPEAAHWHRSVAKAKDAFKSEELSKVVLSRTKILELSDNSWLYWLDQLLRLREDSYLFALRAPDGSTFLGRSPERLLAWRDDEFQIDAIAGTRRRSEDSAQNQADARELLASGKEQQEHRYVSRYVSGLLSSLSLSHRLIDEEKLLQLQHVQHMQTRIQGQLNANCDAFDLLHELHPTPAVGGVPVEPALQFIREHEGYDRGWYAGYIGWFSARAGECAIGIRSALLQGERLQIFGGAGIVEESDAGHEWLETGWKMQNFMGPLEDDLDGPAPESKVQDATAP